jgi:hypothetical protein
MESRKSQLVDFTVFPIFRYTYKNDIPSGANGKQEGAGISF